MAIRAIIGLGNPGPAYASHRHNVGFMVLDALAKKYSCSWRSTKHMMSTEIVLHDQKVLLVKPMTGMNVSGDVIPLLKKSGIDASDIAVVHDELEIAFGKIALRAGGSARGHNGLKSLIAALGSDAFVRVRVGIGRPEHKDEVPTYVLSSFAEDASQRTLVITRAVEQIEQLIISPPL